MRRFLLAGLGSLLLALVVLVVAVLAWMSNGLGPLPEALTAMQSGEGVEVRTDRWYTFSPAGRDPVDGIIIYPGGRVDPRSYAPLARSFAERGYLAVITPMPANTAFLGAGQASDVRRAHPSIRRWIVAGHSLGGVAAASYAADPANDFPGLALWASYPANSISQTPLHVVSIYASEDGATSQASIDASRANLPPGTTFVRIDGGNHAQFGSYGEQPGDNPARISRDEQQRQVVEATIALFDHLGPTPAR
jgi:dienelactone hydrolase